MPQGKFHINSNGVPAQCHATTRPCPLGGAESHFDTMQEAQGAVDARNAEQHGLLAAQDEISNAMYGGENGEPTDPQEMLKSNHREVRLEAIRMLGNEITVEQARVIANHGSQETVAMVEQTDDSSIALWASRQDDPEIADVGQKALSRIKAERPNDIVANFENVTVGMDPEGEEYRAATTLHTAARDKLRNRGNIVIDNIFVADRMPGMASVMRKTGEKAFYFAENSTSLMRMLHNSENDFTWSTANIKPRYSTDEDDTIPAIKFTVKE